MDIKNIISNKDDCALAAKISAYIGIITSLIGAALSIAAIVKKKRGETIPKGLNAAKCVFMVFSVAGAVLGTLFSEKVLDDEDEMTGNFEE